MIFLDQSVICLPSKAQLIRKAHRQAKSVVKHSKIKIAYQHYEELIHIKLKLKLNTLK